MCNVNTDSCCTVSRAGFAGAFIDREAETRGMDFIDRERAKVCFNSPETCVLELTIAFFTA
jgi:hypothetical protein